MGGRPAQAIRAMRIPSPMPHTPTVSVIMAAYNAQAFLDEAVESVLDQTLRDFELLIIDDGSSDETPRIIEHYARLDGRIRPLRHAHNKGVAHAKNTALRHARAPFVAVCDADDRQFPHRLAHQVEALGANPQCVMVGCRVQLVGDVHASPAAWMPVRPGLARARILFQALYGDAANMFRRDLAHRHGLCYRTDAVWEDWVFHAHALRFGEVGVLSEALLGYRRHPAQQTSPDRLRASSERTRTTHAPCTWRRGRDLREPGSRAAPCDFAQAVRIDDPPRRPAPEPVRAGGSRARVA